ncbi:MAG TPA: dTMP kinase [Ignavibacteriaceae bacterium]|nr:dTMP kinase [Ignavibacteriaceae bacterium]
MFITFEGIDFCGKSTQVELLKKYLLQRNFSVEVIREPGGTEISEKIREILLDKKNSRMFSETELLLFSSARAQLVREKIIPLLQKNYVVISDRFHDSSIAYQSYGRGIDIEVVKKVQQLAIGNTIPDLTFLIDISVELSHQRKKLSGRVELDRIENSETSFFQKVRQGYLLLAAEEKRFRVIDGSKSVAEIHEKIIKEIKA